MAATLYIEEESGTTSGRVHPHNGYFAWRGPRVTGRAEPAPGPGRVRTRSGWAERSAPVPARSLGGA